ncbi:hypothetical protein MLD38_016528 [Melastoma candidum]|uniref:Uncharacterized protein n=1 Tax=Melastoma candidum TaxID=119954 RepID=A0ACB9QM16_9MYRT|nr:hypothetical protein MLD38_016528 [Melastoma candidum]
MASTTTSRRIAVVTGGNKGIGLEICKQLASAGIFIVLTARDIGRGNRAAEELRGLGLRDVIFHQLDVLDPASISSLVDFLTMEFGRIDILVNNAGIVGATLLVSADRRFIGDDFMGPKAKALREFMVMTPETAEFCLQTNYYGVKRVTTAILPLLQLSDSPRIVNVSSGIGGLEFIPNEKLREELKGANSDLAEETVDNVVERFLEAVKGDRIDTEGWPPLGSAYIISKAALNAYTKIMAMKHPKIAINAVCPGNTATDLNGQTGTQTVEEGSKTPVTVALLPDGGPSGAFFSKGEITLETIAQILRLNSVGNSVPDIKRHWWSKSRHFGRVSAINEDSGFFSITQEEVIPTPQTKTRTEVWKNCDTVMSSAAGSTIAVVTGGNKGIGLETCKQLASTGVFVVLTARDVGRGNRAVEELRVIGLNNVVFHQLDVLDPASISALADFLAKEYGRVDILVNNAAVVGARLVGGTNRRLTEEDFAGPQAKALKEEFLALTPEIAEHCLRTNYDGVKHLTAAILPLLQLSDYPRIVNVSSGLGRLRNFPNEKLREELNGVGADLTEETIDNVVERFLEAVKNDKIDAEGWPPLGSAYVVSKAVLNAYTRVMAKKYPKITINAVCPGYTATDLNGHTGVQTVEEGGRRPVAVALLPQGGPSGVFFHNGEVAAF